MSHKISVAFRDTTFFFFISSLFSKVTGQNFPGPFVKWSGTVGRHVPFLMNVWERSGIANKSYLRKYTGHSFAILIACTPAGARHVSLLHFLPAL